MAEKMLVTQALDERDKLVNEIAEKIKALQVVDTKKRNEGKTDVYHLSVEELSSNARVAYQQILDMISRYQRIDAALGASNADTVIKTSLGDYTLTGAIALRNRIQGKGNYETRGKFEENLLMKLTQEYEDSGEEQELRNDKLEDQAESMRLSILGRESKGKDDKGLEVVTAFLKENTSELVDPLGCMTKADELREFLYELLSELNTKIKVANATTFIEF